MHACMHTNMHTYTIHTPLIIYIHTRIISISSNIIRYIHKHPHTVTYITYMGIYVYMYRHRHRHRANTTYVHT